MNKRDAPSPNENMAPGGADDLQVTPAKKARITSRKSAIAVAGRVASVKLQNFMCHANLLIEFNTEENNCFYIGGPNGSGKSALFAAINLGLGGRGADNDRGSTVKSYIKDGNTQSKVTITLTNEGLNAHPEYGQLISVERNIKQQSSTYILKSIEVSACGRQTEKVISKKKSDVDRVVSRFNIHLSNPAFWMSQDRSRSFLANFKPSNVYKLYLESTNLENILKSYMRFAVALDECKAIISQKTEQLTNEQRKLKRMQEQRDLQDKVDQDRAMVAVYKWKLMFCKVRDYDDQLKLNERKQVIHSEMHDKVKAEYSANRVERANVEQEGQNIQEEVEVQAMEVEEVQLRLEEKKKELKTHDEQEKEVMKQIKRKKYEIKATQDSIAQAEAEVRSIMEKQGCEKLTKKLAAAEAEYKKISENREEMEMNGELQTLKDKLSLASAELKQKDDEAYEVKRTIGSIRRKIETDTETLRRSRATKKDAINKFGSRMAEIIGEINKNRSQFQQLPKGPLGQYISLTNENWTFPVEECIRNMANQFLCTSQNDASLLRKCFDRLRISANERPTIIVSRFLGRKHSNLQEPSLEFDTVYRMLAFTDPDVHNVLIDKVGCESILLLKEKTEAMDLMGCDHPPNNATKAYTLDGSQAYAGGSSGQYRFYAGRGGKPSGIFGNGQENIDESALEREIEEAKTRLRHLETNELQQCDGIVKELKIEEYSVKSSIDAFEKKLASLRTQEMKFDRILKDLRKEVADTANEDMLDNLNEGIEEQQNKIPKMHEEIREMEEKLAELKEAVRPLLAERDQMEKEYNEVKDEGKDFRSQALKLQKKISKLDEQGDMLKARLDKLKSDEMVLYHNEARLKTEKDDAQAMIDREKTTHPMPSGESDPPNLDDFPATDVARRKLIELQKSVDRVALGCDLTITNEYVKEFKEKLRLYRYYCRKCDDVLETLRQVHEARLKVYPNLKKYTEMKVCDKFQELLAVRGHFLGGLEFDHEKQTLNVNVESCKTKDALAEMRASGVVEDVVEEEEESEEDEDDSEEDSDDDSGPRRKRARKSAKKTKKKKKSRDLKGLSGGERSFVTAALVMSLWEVMEQPFRMMDEFDVFMDMMNRKLVMDLLVELATKKFPHNQFIFFTPQGIKELKKVDGLQIFEMNKVRD